MTMLLKKRSKRINALSKSVKRRIKSHAIKNATGDAQLADRARDWSLDRILNELGIIIKMKDIVTGKPEPLKRMTKKDVAEKQERLDKFKYAIERDVSPLEARQYKRKSYDEIDRFIAFDKPKNTVNLQYKRARTKKQRDALWIEYSKREGRLPIQIEERAKRLNRSKGLDENDHYGFITLYYAFVENEPIARWATIIYPDKYGVAYYINMVKKTKGNSAK